MFNNNNGQKQYDNTNKGAIFVNNKKQSNNHPDMTGKLNIEGTEYYISCWYKQSKNGEQFMSASVKRVDSVDRPVAQQDGFNDQIPF